MLKSAAQFIQRSRITTSGTISRIQVGGSGWQLPDSLTAEFGREGTQLHRYATRLQGVEVMSSFFRSHSRATWQRWRRDTPAHFRFAVRMPRRFTHRLRLESTDGLETFLDEVGGLEQKLGPLLLQLPPGLDFHRRPVRHFLETLREFHQGPVVCEPRDVSWLTHSADDFLREYHIARAATHPRLFPGGGQPGGWHGLFYLRLNGHPKRLRSAYDDGFLEELEERLKALARDAETWCIFNNTATDAGLRNALSLSDHLHAQHAA